MAQKLQELSENISQLTLLEAADLVKILEEKLGVSAAPPMMAMAPTQASSAHDSSEEEAKTEFDVVLVNGGTNKIAVLKAVRSITNLPLKEAKDTAEGSNVVIKSGVSKKEAEDIKKQLEEAGAEVKLS
jgi:large subunit ribosomal protein L7/L12